MRSRVLLLVIVLAAGIALGYGGGLLLRKPGTKLDTLPSRRAASPGAGAPPPSSPAPEELRELKREFGGPPTAPSASQRGDILFEEGRFEEAIEEYKKAVEENPKDVDSWNDLGLSYYYLGEKGQALDALREGVKVGPGFQRIWLSLGFVARGVGRQDEAREAWKKAHELGPETQVGIEAKRFLDELQ